MTRRLPLLKRDYARRHDSARALLRNVDCLSKAMRVRAQQRIRVKSFEGVDHFLLCDTRPHFQCYYWGPRTRSGRPRAVWCWCKENPSQGDGRCGGVVVRGLVGCLGHVLQLATVLARGRGGGGGGDDLSYSTVPFKVVHAKLATVYLRDCTAVKMTLPHRSVLPRNFFLFSFLFRAQPRERAQTVSAPQ